MGNGDREQRADGTQLRVREKEGKELGILTLGSAGSWSPEHSSSLREGRKERGSARAQGPHSPESPQLLSLNHRHKLLPDHRGLWKSQRCCRAWESGGIET